MVAEPHPAFLRVFRLLTALRTQTHHIHARTMLLQRSGDDVTPAMMPLPASSIRHFLNLWRHLLQAKKHFHSNLRVTERPRKPSPITNPLSSPLAIRRHGHLNRHRIAVFIWKFRSWNRSTRPRSGLSRSPPSLGPPASSVAIAKYIRSLTDIMLKISKCLSPTALAVPYVGT